MEQVICPSCAGTAIRMAVLSDISYVDFFQCETCRSVSLAPKDGSCQPVLELMPTPKTGPGSPLTRH